jgi:uroporphyrinogen-III synthase
MGDVDAIVFSSPSAFQNLATLLDSSEIKKLSQSVAFAAIGPTTARAIREAGVPVAIEAARPSSAQITEAMIEFFSKSARVKANR